MSAVDVFRYEGREVRTVLVDGEPWFVAADVCAVLEHSNPTMAVAGLDDDEKGLRNVETPGGGQSLVCVSEAGLYSLILRSRKPEARSFKRWVTHEVLPAIRKTGTYTVPQQMPTHAEALRGWADALEAAAVAQQQVQQLSPRAEAWDDLASAEGDYSVGDAAKILVRAGVATGQNRLFATLSDLGWIFRREGHWSAKQSAVESGLIRERLRPPRYDQVTGAQVTVEPQIRLTAKGVERLRSRMAPKPSALAVVRAAPDYLSDVTAGGEVTPPGTVRLPVA